MAKYSGMQPFDNRNDKLMMDVNGRKFNIGSMDIAKDIMYHELLPDRVTANWYNKCHRFGWIDPFNHDRVTREFLFFTKPDMNFFNVDSNIAMNYNGSTVEARNYNTAAETGSMSAKNINHVSLNPELKNNTIISEVFNRAPYILGQLQNSVTNPDGLKCPFMYLLTNAVQSKLDLPGISADSKESTQNHYGTTIQYRGHSLKSDNNYDFSLTFADTAYLEIYLLAKCYDEYMRACKFGRVTPRPVYIKNRIIPDYFSVYKFLVGSDGETILYYAKLTGCYFIDVPRGDFGDPPDTGFKYSLSFHAQFVEDMDPIILSEFSQLTKKYLSGSYSLLPTNSINTTVNNRWGKLPIIVKADQNNPIYGKRVKRRNGVKYDYFLRWVAYD